MATDTSIAEWIAKSAIPFEVDSPGSIDAAADGMVELLGDSVELLGLADALHGSEEILVIRNRLFKRLVTAHG